MKKKGSYDDWKSADMRCCFFRTQKREQRRIGCEGIFPGSTIDHTFVRQKSFEKHLSHFCAYRYRDCPFYKALMKSKYDDET